MSSLGPISPRSGYSGGSGSGGYYPSDDRQKKKNLTLFDGSSSNKNRGKNKPNSLKTLENKVSDGNTAVITNLEDILENTEDIHQEFLDKEEIDINFDDLMEQEKITINYQEFADDEDASTSGDKVRYINMIINNYLKHIMVFCVVVVAVSVFAFFVLSFINGF